MKASKKRAMKERKQRVDAAVARITRLERELQQAKDAENYLHPFGEMARHLSNTILGISVSLDCARRDWATASLSIQPRVRKGNETRKQGGEVWKIANDPTPAEIERKRRKDEESARLKSWVEWKKREAEEAKQPKVSYVLSLRKTEEMRGQTIPHTRARGYHRNFKRGAGFNPDYSGGNVNKDIYRHWYPMRNRIDGDKQPNVIRRTLQRQQGREVKALYQRHWDEVLPAWAKAGEDSFETYWDHYFA